MRMNLKNRSKKFNIRFKFNSKNLFIFLVSFSILSFIIGILFYFLVSSDDKSSINSVVINNFKIKSSYNYLLILKNNLLSNTYNIFLIWVLGISVIGIIGVLFIYFCELFSLGFTTSAMFYTYKGRGILAFLCYIFPSKIIYVILLFLITYFAIKISYKVFILCFTNDDINIKLEIKKYFKVLLFVWILVVCVSILSVFVDPIFIKLFTKL